MKVNLSEYYIEQASNLDHALEVMSKENKKWIKGNYYILKYNETAPKKCQ